MTHNKTIGLIGGMSWESTIPYYSYSYKEGCRDGAFLIRLIPKDKR